MATTDFLVAVANRVKGMKLCSMPLTLPGAGCENSWLDRITVGEASLAPSDTQAAVTVNVLVTAHFVEDAELPVHGVGHTPDCLTADLVVRLDLTVDVTSAGSANLVLTLSGVDAPGLPQEAATVIRFAMIGLIPPRTWALDLSGLGELTGSTPGVLEGAVATAGGRLAIRLAVAIAGGGALSDASWTSFNNGSFKSIGADPWALFLSKELIEAGVKGRFDAALNESQAGGKLDVESGPHAELTPFLGLETKPVVQVDCAVEAVDACVCFWGEIDLDVDINASVWMSCPKTNSIQAELYLEWDLDDSEVICCSFTAAAFWPLIGTNLLEEGKINWGEFFAGLGMPVAFTAGLLGAHDAADDEIAKGLAAEFEEIEKAKHYRLTQPFNFDVAGAGLSLTKVLAKAGGLVLAGTLTAVAQRVQADVQVIGADELNWEVQNPCGHADAMSVAAVWKAVVSGTPVSGNFNQMVPFSVCDVQIISADPRQQFTPYFKAKDGKLTLTVPFKKLDPVYAVEPYACQVQVVTSAGVRVLTIPPLPDIEAEQVEQMIQDALDAQIVECHEWVEEQFWNEKLFLPKWLPDPPPFHDTIVQHWNMVFSGLVEGELVTVQDPVGGKLAEFTGVANSPPTGELSIQRVASARETIGLGLRRTARQMAERRQVAMQQQTLVRRATLPLGGAARGWCASGGSTVAVATRYGVTRYDLAQPGLPEPVGFWPGDGLLGVVSWHGRLLTWDDTGLWPLDGGGAKLTLGQLRAVAVDRGLLYALDAENLRSYRWTGRRLTLVKQVPISGGQTLAAGAGALAVGSAGEVRFLDGANLTSSGRATVSTSLPPVPTRYGSSAAFLLGTEVYMPGRAAPVARYTRQQPLSGAVRARRAYVAAGPGDHLLRIYEVRSSAAFAR